MGRKKGGYTQAERCFLILNRLRGTRGRVHEGPGGGVRVAAGNSEALCMDIALRTASALVGLEAAFVALLTRL